MRKMTYAIAAIAFVFFIFSPATVSFAGQSLWPNNKGELCWDVYIWDEVEEKEICTGLVKLAVMKTVGDHYIVHGTNTEAAGAQLANGNAEIIDDDSILINVSSAGLTPDTEVRGFMGLVVLDADTLNGTVEGIGVNYDTVGGSGKFSYDGVQYMYYDPTCTPNFE